MSLLYLEQFFENMTFVTISIELSGGILLYSFKKMTKTLFFLPLIIFVFFIVNTMLTTTLFRQCLTLIQDPLPALDPILCLQSKFNVSPPMILLLLKFTPKSIFNLHPLLYNLVIFSRVFPLLLILLHLLLQPKNVGMFTIVFFSFSFLFAILI